MSWKFDIDLPMPFEMRLNAHEYASRAKMPVVRSSDEAWEAFARADEEFQEALRDQLELLTNLLQQNPFGHCIEGTSMHRKVLSVIRDDSPSIHKGIENQIEFLNAHAAHCRSTSQRISTADTAVQ